MNLSIKRIIKIFLILFAYSFILTLGLSAKTKQTVTATSWLVADGNGKIIKSVNQIGRAHV